MITKIGIEFKKNNSKFNNLTKNKISSQNTDISTQNNTSSNNTPSGVSLNYFVPFTAKKDSRTTKLDTILYYSNAPAKKLINQLKIEAKESGYSEITTLHVIKHSLIEINQYIDDLNNKVKDFDSDNQPDLAKSLTIACCATIVSDKKIRNKVKPIIEKEIEKIDKILEEEKSNHKYQDIPTQNITLSEDLTDAIFASREKADEAIGTLGILTGALSSGDKITEELLENMLYDLNEKVMENHDPLEKRSPFSEYETKAKNVLKNLYLGTNVYLTYDNTKEFPQYFLDTLHKVVAESDDKKVILREFNTLAKGVHLEDVINKISKDKDHKYIIILNPTMISYWHSENAEGMGFDPTLAAYISDPPSNVKFLFYDTKNNYYTQMTVVSHLLSDFYETSLPALNTKQMVKSFKENRVNLMEEVNKKFDTKAIEKVVEASAQLDGGFPEKTINLMKQIASYYIDKNTNITEIDVANYVKEATHIFKKNSNDNAIDVIFNTGVKLKDLIGKESTKKEAEAIIKQIRSNKMGTKGVVIYAQDGTAGSGRKFTAKAIAGESRIPYIEMNTMDFGTKEVDLFGNLSPEASVKKLFSHVTTQAEANSNKSALLYIENFELFSVGGELGSLYHQKAMSQLIKEMEKANKMGLNILVVGSVSDPSLIGTATMKSLLFTDSIGVDSPAFNKTERAKVLQRVIKDARIKLDYGNLTPDEFMNNLADITQYFPYINIKNLVKKAQTVASERNHKQVTKSDFIEAYLQIYTGRPSLSKLEAHEQRITASHECGHAVNLEVMNTLTKKMGKPWHIPHKVNFITLDPRGFFGGAVFSSPDMNRETTFESEFADLVMGYGGNSAEERFFGINGSFGIYYDMKSAREQAERMVRELCMGYKTGVMAVNKDENLSDEMKRRIEDDEEVILNNAKIASDEITRFYADFNQWFTDKYAPRVGTGDCLLDGNTFKKELEEWKAQLSPEKRKNLEFCDKELMTIIDCTKKGIKVRKAENVN